MFSLGLVILCIISLINPISCYIPEPRMGHSSLVIQNHLLVLGGWKNSSFTTKKYTDEIFYLNLAQKFDGANPLWEIVLGGNLPLYSYYSASFVSTLDDNIIYLIGGYMKNITTGVNDFSNLIYMYNYSSHKWTAPDVGSVTPRQEIVGLINDKGIVYIFGGFNVTNDTAFDGTYYNDMRIFNVSSMELSSLSITQNLPSPCSAYTANLLKNGIIVYFGGLEADFEAVYPSLSWKLLNFTTLKLFDTIKAEWSYMTPIGAESVDSRFWHTTILNTRGEIILFGGCLPNYTRINTKLAILNTNKDIYEWRIPSLSNSPPYLYGHSANLHGDYMIITFGHDMDNSIMSSRIYLFDVNQYTWVTTYTPPPVTTVLTNNSASKKSKALEIGLGVGVGGVLIILASIGVIFFKKRETKSNTPILEIASSEI
ncbi:hypothetical protein Glove_22g88 [Diversispora epigaea]|uniref:Galactose oxidase n=1 Tax=Diversispora epigaea TaxID=1348612 RepID=A0A397JTQ6_9GLOM|nr:hypothetical protein Glove_22g88 [Diversispora epigaea]